MLRRLQIGRSLAFRSRDFLLPIGKRNLPGGGDPSALFSGGPTGRDRIAQGTARNERRPGFQSTVAKALKGRDNASPARTARIRNVPLPPPAVASGSLRSALSRPVRFDPGWKCRAPGITSNGSKRTSRLSRNAISFPSSISRKSLGQEDN